MQHLGFAGREPEPEKRRVIDLGALLLEDQEVVRRVRDEANDQAGVLALHDKGAGGSANDWPRPMRTAWRFIQPSIALGSDSLCRAPLAK